jgi:predicted transport protein
MPIFNINNSKLSPIREKDLGLEKDVQRLTEENLEIVFGLNFIRSEFSIGSFRLDTVAFDDESKAFVIIEYKRDKSFSVIDQGYAYLALMLNNKAEFVLSYNEKMGASLKKDDVDWSQSRVIFLARSFTSYQQNAINFRDLPIELWEVKKYDNSTILYNQLLSQDANDSVRSITKNKTVESVAKEIKVYTVEDHKEGASEEIKEIFENVRQNILALSSDVKEVPKKLYIAYKLNTNFADIEVRSKDIKIFLNLRSGELDDPRNVVRDLSKPKPIGHWGNGDYEINIKNQSEVPYVLGLVEQAFAKQMKK